MLPAVGSCGRWEELSGTPLRRPQGSESVRCHRTHKGTGRLRTGKRDQEDLGVASTVPTAAFTIG